MTKCEFLSRLREALRGMPQKELEERLLFYAEMIDDRMEDGISEEEAVDTIGTVEEIAAQFSSEIPFESSEPQARREKRHRLRTWEIVLLILGFPVWLPLLLAAFVILLALDAVLWSLVAVLWALELSFAALFLGGTVYGIVVMIFGNPPLGIAAIGAALLFAGLAIFLFFGCVAAVKGSAFLTARAVRAIISVFKGGE